MTADHIQYSHAPLKIASSAAILRLMERVRGLQAVVVSTEDGFEVAA